MIYALIFVFVVLVCVCLFLSNNMSTHTPEPVADYSRRILFTETESRFFHVLRQAVPEQFDVWGKLGLWSIVFSKKNWAKIAQKQLDFVIVRKGAIPDAVFVVELDDYTHRRASVSKRDLEKDAILKSAGIPILRVEVSKEYDLNDLRNKIQVILNNSDSNK